MRMTPLGASLLAAMMLAGCGGQTTSSVPAAPERPRLAASIVQAAQPIVLSGPMANYSISKTTDGYVLTDTSGAEATRTVSSTARLRFSDSSLSFDVDGIPGQAYRLYRAAFARTPDVAGLGFWLGVLDQGNSLEAVAQGFVESNEYKALYASASTNSDIVNKYYVNVLSRKGEAAGVAFWSGILDRHEGTVAGVLTGFSESPENKSGTAAGVQYGIVYQEYGVNYPDAVHSFPLRSAYKQRALAGTTDYLTISGNCSGYAAFANAAAVSSNFEGKSATTLQTNVSLGLTTCSPASLGWSLVDYFDSSDALVGHYEPGSEYDVASGSQRSLPLSAKIGDKGVYATQARYTDSNKTGTPGQRVMSYSVEADGNSPTTAILKLTAVHSTSAGATTLTRTTNFRIGINGALDQISVDEVYASNGIHLLYTQNPATAQPSKLIITDTLVGTGAVSQNGQTLTVNYTGWLYNPGVNDFKGTQFDSSVGRGAFSFKLGAGAVIQGWDQGMLGMKVGGKRTLLIPSNMGYGTTGAGAGIPGNAALVFEVELISVK